MAEAILGGLLYRHVVSAQLESAGLLTGGQQMAPEAFDAITRLGTEVLDMSSHRSKRLAASDVERADLVLGMAREHVREAAVLVPAAWDRTFTLKELVRRGEVVGSRGEDQALSAWLAVAAAGRSRGGQLGSSRADDVADPIGGTPVMFEKTAAEIELLCRRLVALLWGFAPGVAQ